MVDGLCCYIVLCVLFVIIGAEDKVVSYGSVIKLMNVQFHVRLHSHDVNYGTGSGQQSVTASHQQEDVNSHWIIMPPTKATFNRGDPVECGDTIRLQHLGTHKNLHSHHFSSPLSGNQEVSAFGVNGEGDSGDHWNVICSGSFWERDDEIMFKHVDTNVYLSVSGRQYGSPISGQMEVVGTSRMSSVNWKAAEGFFIHQGEMSGFKEVKDELEHHIHTEL